MSPVSQKLSFPARLALIGCIALVCTAAPAQAQNLHIHLPKRSKPTPVQKLNQDGVKAVQKHDYERAKKLFYKAYLLDPNDPFTLNNLGYIAEIDGDLDRAQRFYSLAAEQPSEAAIAQATNPDVKGKQVAEVAGNAVDQEIAINRSNVYAIGLLMKDRAPEADVVLQKTLKLDPHNAFTLNNLGFAKEKEGELEDAVKYYNEAAATGSNEPVVVTLHKDWRGKPIRDIAEDNAKAVQKVLQHGESPEQRIARLNLRGVSAINRNQRGLAKQYFEDAYKIDPNNSFTLNNMGYLAEMDGDRETAQFYYAKAREGGASDARVVLATRRDMEGQRMGAVAAVNDQTVDDAMQRDLEARRRQGGIVALLNRKNNNAPVVEPAAPVHPTHSDSDTVLIPRENGAVPANQPGNGTTILETEPSVIPPLPSNQQPNVQPEQNVIPPLPENQQPPTANQPGGQPASNPPATQPQTQPQVQPEQKVIPPLPDNQQPPSATGQPSNPPSSQQAQPPQNQQQSQPQGGVIPPLPDNQQPANAGSPAQQKPPQ